MTLTDVGRQLLLDAANNFDYRPPLNFIWYWSEDNKPVNYNMPRAWEGAYCGPTTLHEPSHTTP